MDHLLIETDLEPGSELVPSPDVQRHIKALRLREGDHVRVLNGRGFRADCVVSRFTVSGLPLTVDRQPQTVNRQPLTVLRVASTALCPPPADITIAIGIMENRDRFEYAVEKVSELGVRRIVPLASVHSSRRIPGRDRLVAKIRAACEQSGNPWLPLLEEPMSVDEILAHLEQESTTVAIVGAQNGERPAPLPEGPLMIIVGPEGGLHPEEERRLLSAGARSWKVGDQRLRAETAAVALTVAALIERPASAS